MHTFLLHYLSYYLDGFPFSFLGKCAAVKVNFIIVKFLKRTLFNDVDTRVFYGAKPDTASQGLSGNVPFMDNERRFSRRISNAFLPLEFFS